MTSESRIQYAVSDDTGGRFGSARTLVDTRPFNGPIWVEKVAFGPMAWLKYQVRQLERRGYRVAQFHSFVGFPEGETLGREVRRWAAQSQLVGVRTIAEHFPGYQVLVHAPAASRISWSRELRDRAIPSFIYIENDQPGEVGMRAMRKEVERLDGAGIRGGGMFDMFHYMRTMLDTTIGSHRQAWRAALVQIVKDREYIAGFHVAHGHPMDAIPETILADPAMLRDLADLVRPPVRSVTFEDQWPGRRSWWLSSVDVLALRSRKYEMYKRFIDVGLLKLE